MSAKPFRVPAQALKGNAGRLVNREKLINFTFDGKEMSAFPGDTLASALMANGQRLVGRSFKYHRPRGLLGLGAEEPNALITVGEDDKLEPNIRATQIEVFDGIKTRSQNCWPNLKYDIGAINNKVSRMLPSGFYYKTFMGPVRGAWMMFEPMIRKSAGLGPAPHLPDPDLYEQLKLTCDVLVIGGGVAGLVAAKAAADEGVRVILCDENPRLGGTADIMPGKIEGSDALQWAKQTVNQLAEAPNVHLLTRTTGVGHYDHNYVYLSERVSDHSPHLTSTKAPRHRLWKVRTKQTILASGSLERPITFANNDRPGVMLSSAVRGYVNRYGVVPGRRGVVFTNNDDAYLTALTLHDAGINVPCIVDVRSNPKGDLIDQAKAAGIPLNFGSMISGVVDKNRGCDIGGVLISGQRSSGRFTATKSISCDFVAMSGGWNPVIHLFCHAGGKPNFNKELQTFVPGTTREQLTVIGAANGIFSLADIVLEAQKAGYAAAISTTSSSNDRSKKPAKALKTETIRTGKIEPIWYVPSSGPKDIGNKHFIDFQNDVTAADLELATREGYRSVEHVKRYTTTGMATDQGKTSNINALGILSDCMNKPIPDIGTTTFRPPYTPVSFGALAGLAAKDLFQPVRKTPITGWHEENGADFEPVGQWQRPYCYLQEEENREAAVNREILATRQSAGLIDVSTLGKIELKGSDAGKFLDRIYSNMMSTLKVGRCRYGLMMDEQGFLFDDGVVVRFADDHFLIHTTSGNSDHISGWLEQWLQTEWPELNVFISPVTEQWAQIGVAGPKAREILMSLNSDIEWSNENFPPLTYKQGKILGTTARIYRISFSGELSYEIAVPANLGLPFWNSILEAGKKFDITPYGTEALHVLRAEKGFIAIGDETDGMTTPLDLGLSWAVSKKKSDFIGKHSLSRPHMATLETRKQLVGVLTEDAEEILPIGCYCTDEEQTEPPVDMTGHISSSYWSPTLDRSIALALVVNGRNRHGETVYFPLEKKVVKGKIVDPVFFDKEGKRQNG